MKREPVLWHPPLKKKHFRKPKGVFLEIGAAYFWKQKTFRLLRVGETYVVLEDMDDHQKRVHIMPLGRWLTFVEEIE